jgi:K+-sensing histidine kinase KdpD
MKRISLFFVLLLLCAAAGAQHKVTFILKENTYSKHDSIFITGTFNNWDSTRNSRFRLTNDQNGVHSKILGKIFQPFFTTKPTGQGTGLGLSLAYDIIKAHGGEIRVETKEGEGSEFVIWLII